MKTTSGTSTRIISSDTIAYLFYKAAIECNDTGDRTQCNQLLHLCVLHLYDPAMEPCSFFHNVIASANAFDSAFYDTNWKVGYPWMDYSASTATLLSLPDKVQFKVSLGSTTTAINSLPLYLAKWSFDGTYLGFEPLTDQLTLCPAARTVVDEVRRFGSNINYECNIDLRTLLDKGMTDEQVYYSLWLVDSAQGGVYVDVPVLIRNMRDLGGGKPNAQDNNKANWVLVRRFFLFDRLSGITDNNSFLAQDSPDVLRFAASTKLLVELQT